MTFADHLDAAMDEEPKRTSASFADPLRAFEDALWSARIPRETPDCLRVFGLSVGATKDELKRAFRSAVLRTHPDHGGTARDFQEVMRAYDEAVGWV